VSLAQSVQTFRARVVAQFIGVQGEMTLPAAQRAFSEWQQFERGVVAGAHRRQTF
jgi:hypothetical protein